MNKVRFAAIKILLKWTTLIIGYFSIDYQ